MRSKPSTAWTKHLRDPVEVEAFIKTVLGSVTVRDRLAELINEKLKALEPSEVDYDSPSWSHKQAHQNGLKQAYGDILKLITF